MSGTFGKKTSMTFPVDIAKLKRIKIPLIAPVYSQTIIERVLSKGHKMKLRKNFPDSTIRPEIYGQDSLREIVKKLSFPRVIDTPGNEKARHIIWEEFFNITGRMASISDGMKNVILGDPDYAKVIVGAHYDSVPNTPGADDNASALAAMFRIAANIKPPFSDVCFVAFNGEEYNLQGSKEFVKMHSMSNVQQVHILEMVGYRSFAQNSQKNPLGGMVDIPTIGDFIGVVANDVDFMKIIMDNSNYVNIPVIGLDLPNIGLDVVENLVPHLFRSDHASFWKVGKKAAMWTDTAEFRNSNYHQESDTPDTLDYDFISSVSDVILDVVNFGL